MRIPRVYEQSKIDRAPSETVTVDVRPELYIDDMSLFEDKKSYMKFLYTTEKVIRNSFEYEDFISFLKHKRGLNHCGVHPNQKSSDGFRIELHHTPFQLSDLTSIVINKRTIRKESLKMQDIAKEVMELHYLEIVGIYPLCMLCHSQVHSEKMDPMYIPMRNVFGHPERFAELYYQYMTDSMRNKWNNIKALERGHKLIDEILPPELRKKYIYIKPYDNDSTEVIGTNKLIDFMQQLQQDTPAIVRKAEAAAPKKDPYHDSDGFYKLIPRAC